MCLIVVKSVPPIVKLQMILPVYRYTSASECLLFKFDTTSHMFSMHVIITSFSGCGFAWDLLSCVAFRAMYRFVGLSLCCSCFGLAFGIVLLYYIVHFDSQPQNTIRNSRRNTCSMHHYSKVEYDTYTNLISTFILFCYWVSSTFTFITLIFNSFCSFCPVS